MNTSNPIPSEMEYIKYLNFGFDIAIIVLHVTTIFFTFHVIYCSQFDKKSMKLNRISNSFFIFLASRGVGAMFAVPYPVYLIAYWTADGGNHYKPYAHLWFGLGMLIHGHLFTLSALLLTLERCLALAFPMQYNSSVAKWFPWFTLTCYILNSILIVFYVLIEIPLDVEKMRNCQYLACVLLKYRFLMPQYVKFGTGGLNVLGSCYLMRAMKWNNEQLKNDVVKFTITLDIFLDVIPTFANFMFNKITGFSITVYTGQSLIFLALFNVAVCSIYYSWRLTRKTNGFWIKICRVQQVSPAATTI